VLCCIAPSRHVRSFLSLQLERDAQLGRYTKNDLLRKAKPDT
jgi:hypothetical protein